ncbi:selenium metabolism protein YedF [Desulfovibrio sp. X2]|uniref:sulfurtransferase-like selenium metabolism protein YedF n=1 Tax=Desulfovibrio sp. X2 TaxID=941449 RepID=UPI00035897D5|nr:sulfurtransferase-like selenium metabolism protein YedF [Desulfovibrio sp. X2]EPR42282.1 selenium metabolism protein YedF [Desulfovibrio sp. X2]
MPDFELDCQGLPCPQPVLRCKRLIDENAPALLKVTVDNEPAKENVSRFLSTQGYAVDVAASGAAWVLTGTRGEGAGAPCGCEVMSDAELKAVGRKTVCFITSATVGSGDDTLGGKLMVNFLATLPELGEDLWRIVLVNGGVKLACHGSPCLEKLQALAGQGVSILVCGTCLDFFGLLDKKAVGDTTNMLDVVTSLQAADKVIKI